MLPPADETDELHHHDQRPRGGLGQSQSIDHLFRLQPTVILDRFLRDVGQHRVGSAKGDHGRLAEKDALLGNGVVGSQSLRSDEHWRPPQADSDQQQHE